MKRKVKLFLKYSLTRLGKLHIRQEVLIRLALVVMGLVVVFMASNYIKDKIGNTIEDVSKTVVVSEQEIIKKIKTHTSTPEEDPIAVVRVQNADTLRTQQPFYKDVQEGDYIVIFSHTIIIYNLREDKIVAKKEGVAQ
jgi:hypothetical protein